jgi:hypothetical protein
MCLALWGARGASVYVAIPLGAVVYAAAILLLKEVTLDDLRAVKDMLRARNGGGQGQ